MPESGGGVRPDGVVSDIGAAAFDLAPAEPGVAPAGFIDLAVERSRAGS
jgi:hypothetical protein